jgi:hypothetical protein
MMWPWIAIIGQLSKYTHPAQELASSPPSRAMAMEESPIPASSR